MPGAPLTEDEVALWAALEEASGVDQLVGFVPLATPWYAEPEHLRPLADLFYRADRDGNVRALSSTPPQHGKTESMLHWIVWYLLRNPKHTVAYVSYEAGIAHAKSRTCRDIAERAGLSLDPNTRAAAFWKTNEGGGLLATGMGGRLTGFKIDLMVIDDPHKGRVEAESNVYQQRALDWARATAFTRLSPQASVIVNMARWSDGDLIGRLSTESGIKWEVVNLEAIIDEGTPNERALAEDLKPLEWLRGQRRLLGPYDWASLYCGRPQPRGGALFKDPAYYRAFLEIAGARLAIACDPAASAKTSADHSVIVVVGAVGEGLDQKVYVLDVWRGQVEIPQLVEQLRRTQENWRCPVYVEAQGGFKAVPQMLRAIGAPGGANDEDQLRVVEITVSADKFTRALPVAAAWNDGRVLLPFDPEPWKGDFLREVKKFTGKGDKQDDQVDALSHAFTAVDRRAVGIRRGVQPQSHGRPALRR